MHRHQLSCSLLHLDEFFSCSFLECPRVFNKKEYPAVYSYLPTPPLGQDMTQGQFFKRSLTGLNSEFSFSKTSCLTKAEEPSLLYYLPIAGGKTIGFIPFPRVLVLCEMQSVSSRIWTCVTVSISFEDNHSLRALPNIQLYIPLLWFLLQSFVSNFNVLVKFSFLIFFLSSPLIW